MMHSLLGFIALLSLVIHGSLGQHLSEQPNVNLTTLQISDARGNRSVSYFLIRGYAIVEGDIVYGTEAELLARAVNRPSNGNVTVFKRGKYSNSKRSNSVFPPSAWPGGVVRYQYQDATMESKFAPAMNGAIDKWKAVVPCIQFEKRAIGTGGADPPDALVIKAGDPLVPACFAPLGGPGAILLVDGCGIPELTHEIGHALGLIHEQHRYDRDLNTQFFCKNLIDYPYAAVQTDENGVPLQLPAFYGGGTYGGDSCCGEDYPGVCCGWACQFSRVARAYTYSDQPPSDNGLNGGNYDINSIMHYRTNAFARGGLFTLSKGPTNNPDKISAGDAARVRELFGCPSPPEPSCPKGCNFISGLNLCHVPSAQTCIFPTAAAKTPYCACPAGYKSGYPDDDVEHQWRVNDPGQIDRVWVAEGVACDILCDQPYGTGSCREVKVLPDECIR